MTTVQQLLIVQRDSGKELSKSQKQFNRYVKQINDMKAELESVKSQLQAVQSRIHAEIAPLEKKLIGKKKELIYLLDRSYKLKFFRKREKENIAEIILTQSYDLIHSAGLEELEEIHRKYAAIMGLDEEDQEEGEDEESLLKGMLENMFGVEMDENQKFESPEELFEHLKGKLDEKQAQHQEKKGKRKKTPAQLAKEERIREEAKNITRASRTIYTELVKALHPDREPDEAEKRRKTEIMHRVTEAYEQNDLFELLRLRIEFLTRGKGEGDQLADDHLKYFNKILKEQVDELSNELFQVKGGFDLLGNNLYYRFCGNAKEMDAKFKRETGRIKKMIKSLDEDLQLMEDPAYVRSFLKSYFEARKSPFPF